MRNLQLFSALALPTALFTAAIAGCGGGVGVPEGPMPEGGSYTGVWHSPQYGEMHLVQTDAQVIGEYTKDERQGRITGTVNGNVLRFEWSEERELIANVPSRTRGRGYFRYMIGDDGDHYIRGEWGHDDSVSGGGEWNAVRDRRRRPSVGSGSEGSTSGDENVEAFDSSGGGGDDFDADSGSSDSGGGDDLDLGGL